MCGEKDGEAGTYIERYFHLVLRIPVMTFEAYLDNPGPVYTFLEQSCLQLPTLKLPFNGTVTVLLYKG